MVGGVKVKIGSHRLPIVLKEQDGDYGSYTLTDGLLIDPNQSPSVMASSLLHEALHAVWEVHQIPSTVTEEEACAHLEGPLLEFLVENYGLIQALRMAVLKDKPLPL